jgi:sulfite exporter TauE/SafE
MMPLVGGLALGIAASGHCMAMCGPLVLVLGGSLVRTSRFNQARTTALYHAGRVVMYLLLALPAGVIGQNLALGGFSRGLSIVAGLMLLAGAAGAFHMRLAAPMARSFAAATSRVCAAALHWRRGHPISGSLASGAANGLLPCGLVYAAVAAATGVGDVGDAALLVTGFGLGTTPALVAMSVAPAWVPISVRRRTSRLRPWLLAATALLLIARGLWPSTTSHPHPHDVSHVALVDGR